MSVSLLRYGCGYITRTSKKRIFFKNYFMKIITASGLKCWRCSSDASNSKFCGASIDLSQITELQKRYNYAECDAKPPSNVQNSENLIPKCRVLLQLGE